MSFKTEYNTYNDDDFIENDGTMNELTVTITLCEYRNLIEERVYNEKAISELQDENEKLRARCEVLLQLYLKEKPDIRAKIIELSQLTTEEIKALLH